MPHLVDRWCERKAKGFFGDRLACLETRRTEGKVRFDLIAVLTAAAKRKENQN